MCKMEEFVNDKLVVDFVTIAFYSGYNKELCPKWIIFDKFKEETIISRREMIMR